MSRTGTGRSPARPAPPTAPAAQPAAPPGQATAPPGQVPMPAGQATGPAEPAPAPTARPGWATVPLAVAGFAATLAWAALLRDGAGVAGVAAPVVAAAAAAGTVGARLPGARASAGRAGAATVVLGVLGALLCACWTVVPGTTVAGLPGPASVRELANAWTGATAALGHATPPVQATTAMRLAVAAAAGVLTAVAQAVWTRWHRPLPALAPLAVALVGGATLGTRRDLVAVGCFLVAATATVLVAGRDAAGSGALAATGTGRAPSTGRTRRTGGTRRTGRAWATGPTVGRSRCRWPAGLLGAALGVVVAAAGVAAAAAPLAGSRITVHLFGTGADAAQQLVVRQPSADLLPYKLHLAGTKVFTVTARLPSYWQLTTLDTFTGTRWVSTATPGPPPPRRGQPATPSDIALVQHVDVQGLVSPWLPAAPEPVAVRGAGNARIDSSGAVVASGPLRQFEVTSAVTVLPASRLRALPAPAPARWLAPYLRLPSIPPSVARLAHRLVAGLSSPYERALALVAYFNSGRFRYTLSPPAYPARANPLVGFLMVTRAGYCQQFASAFAVLARLDGLPTRLAVGFTPGQPVGHDVYQVTGVDAHVWPEVHLGGNAGWVSFEPTPAAGQPAASAAPRSALPATASAPAHSHVTPVGVEGLAHPPATAKATPAGRHASTSPAPRPAAPAAPGGGTAVAAAATAAVGVTALVGVLARRRSRRRGRDGPAERIDRAWASASAGLARRHLGPVRGETPREYAGRLAAAADPGPSAGPARTGMRPIDALAVAAHRGTAGAADGSHPSPMVDATGGGSHPSPMAATAGTIAELAGLVEAARYGRRPPSAADAEHARRLAAAARRAARGVPRPPRDHRAAARRRGSPAPDA